MPPALSRAAVVDACRYADTVLAYRQRITRTPGVQAAVLYDGEIVLSCAHGVADVATGAALTTAHRFRIASHSKMFTATAALQLVEQGALRLDDTAAQWLAFLRDTALANVTVRELLSHAGGIVRDSDHADFWQLVEPFPDDNALVRIASAANAGALARNERMKYSNIGFGLAGLVVAAASGRPYADQVRDRILNVLALTDTAVDTDGDDRLATAHSALSYADERVPIVQVGTGALAPATGFVSTATDVVRFAAAHFLGDDRLLADDSKRLMQRTEVTGEPNDGAYGLGTMIAEVGGRRLIGHGGGWPGHITRTMIDPDARLAVSVLTNAIDGPATALATLVVQLVDLAAQTAPDERQPADPASFRGRFANLWGVFDLVDLGGRLYRIDPGGPDPAGDAQHLSIVDHRTVRITKSSAFASPGELLQVERDATGAIVAIRAGMTSYPLEVVTGRVGTLGRIRVGDRLGP